MTEQTQKTTEPTNEQPMNRRRLLKVAAATAPFIATLPSGAALARSSYLVGPTTGTGTDGLGRTLCLDLNSGTYENGVVDLGTPPSGEVQAIVARDYYTSASNASPITEADMCKLGGEFYYKNSGWQPAKVSRGIVMSATVLSSLVGALHVSEV